MYESVTLQNYRSEEGVSRKTLLKGIIMKEALSEHRQILVPAAAVIRVVQVLVRLTRRKGCVDRKIDFKLNKMN
jgi:hypothetical protein